LLDTYSGAAAAYSLRQLSSSYSGSAIRVRRSSDNAEQDIGFASNELDTTALTSFCGAGNGFVTTWYDQSISGNNFTQTTAAYQPQIVSSGNILTQNGKPSISFNGTNQNLTCISKTISTGDSSLFIAYKGTASADNNILALQSGSSYYFLNYKSYIYYGTVSTAIGGSPTLLNNSNFQLISINLEVGVTQTFYQNNTLVYTKSSPTVSGQTYDRLCGTAFGQPYAQSHCEIIAYPTNQIVNRDAINTNIMAYYGL